MSIEPIFRSKEALDAKAESLLEEYRGSEVLRKPVPLDIDDFAEFFLEASIDYQRLSMNGSILGMSVFQELPKPIVGPNGNEIDVVFPAETIVIDPKAFEGSPESRLRFTLAHECAHLILHRNIFYHDPAVKHASNNGYKPFKASSEEVRTDKFDRAEYQANYLGASLLMPRSTFSKAFQELVSENWCELAYRKKVEIVQDLAGTFDVSQQAAAIRIKGLKLAA